MAYPYFNPYQQMYMSQPAQDQLQQLRQPYQQMQMPQAQTTNTDERIWVQGKEAALSYLVAPNGFVRLWDSQNPVFYEKRADNTGRPSMEAFKYERVGADVPNVASQAKNDYMEQINALKSRIEALENMMQKGNKNEQSDAND